MIKEFQLLDKKGFLRYLDRFGDELTIVNAARVSFGVQKEALEENDEKLIRYLWRHEHTSPFRHVFFRFHIRAPEFVMRQWYKHVVGSEWGPGHQLHGWNEISGRYVKMHDLYEPAVWRRQSEDRKQGSDGVVSEPEQKVCHERYLNAVNGCLVAYQKMIDMGVAREQARMVLPLSVYTECIWTVSLQALLHFVRLRDESHAQEEIREYARVFSLILEEEFPATMRAIQEAS
jgi:thymidylate synthase (FAD)